LWLTSCFEFTLSGLRSGLRGRSFHAVFLLGVLLIGVAYLSGFFSPRQPQTVALDVGFSGVRFSLVLLNLFWVQELVAREIDRRVILFSLAYPVSRGAFLAGRSGGRADPVGAGGDGAGPSAAPGGDDGRRGL
jgi:Cu-processing system permease protein